MTAKARKLDFDALVLAHGAHKKAADGLCLLEACAYIAGEKHSDHPECVSPVLAAYGRRLNDGMNGNERQRLKPYVTKLLNTKDPEKEQTRYRILAWAACTEILPAMLRMTEKENLIAFAERLEKLPRYDWEQARAISREARSADAADAAYASAASAAAYAYAAAAAAAASATDAAYASAAAAAAAASAAADAADAADAAYAAYAASAASAAYAASAAAAASAASAAYAADAASAASARAKIFDLALASFDRAIRCEEVAS